MIQTISHVQKHTDLNLHVIAQTSDTKLLVIMASLLRVWQASVTALLTSLTGVFAWIKCCFVFIAFLCPHVSPSN